MTEDYDWEKFVARIFETVDARRIELEPFFPALKSGVPYDLLAQVGAAKWAVRQGLLEQTREADDRLRDIELVAVFSQIKENEAGARLHLHILLSEALLEDRLSPTMREVLRAMHIALARGAPADLATLTKGSASGRTRNSARDHSIRKFVAGHINYNRMTGANIPITKIHHDAARIFGLKPKTVANICAAENPDN